MYFHSCSLERENFFTWIRFIFAEYILMPSYFDYSCSPVSIGDVHINCLMYADDVVLMSSSKEGLQNRNNKLPFAENWHLTVNLSKPKVSVFNKSGHLKKIYINFNNKNIIYTSRYTLDNIFYVGIFY